MYRIKVNSLWKYYLNRNINHHLHTMQLTPTLHVMLRRQMWVNVRRTTTYHHLQYNRQTFFRLTILTLDLFESSQFDGKNFGLS